VRFQVTFVPNFEAGKSVSEIEKILLTFSQLVPGPILVSHSS
jgi:hypothetical protein